MASKSGVDWLAQSGAKHADIQVFTYFEPSDKTKEVLISSILFNTSSEMCFPNWRRNYEPHRLVLDIGFLTLDFPTADVERSIFQVR